MIVSNGKEYVEVYPIAVSLKNAQGWPSKH